MASGLPSSSTLAWYKMLESWHLAPSIGQLTVPPPAVAVAVLGQLALEHLVLAEYLVVVGGDNLGEVGLGPVRELDHVPVEGAPQLMSDREALVQQSKEVSA